jgi:hypothetical protein
MKIDRDSNAIVSERAVHPNDNAREAKASLWIFEGSSLFVLIGAAALALGSYRFCVERLNWSLVASIGVGAAPLLIATAYVLALKVGKPKSYDVDFFRSLSMRCVRKVAKTGCVLIRVELQGIGGRKSEHPYQNRDL